MGTAGSSMKQVKVTLIALAGLVVLLAGLALKTMRDAGSFKELEVRYPGVCHEIGELLSSEDLAYHRASGTLLVSSDDRRAHVDGRAPEPGAILGYRPSEPDAGMVNLTPALDFELNPHGISLVELDHDRAVLFVVNHRSAGDFVEIFDYATTGLSHRASISGELMTSPNDVVGVSETTFYVSNDHGHPRGLLRAVEEYGQRAWSYLLFHDGTGFRKVADGIGYANGVELSPDGKVVYVAATTDRGIHLFDRDATSGDLSPRAFIYLDTGVDNLFVEPGGDLWVAAHPKLLTFVAHSKDAGLWSPSEVLHIREPTGAWRAETVLMDPGERLSASSVAIPVGQELYVGSVFDPRVLACRLGGD